MKIQHVTRRQAIRNVFLFLETLAGKEVNFEGVLLLSPGGFLAMQQEEIVTFKANPILQFKLSENVGLEFYYGLRSDCGKWSYADFYFYDLPTTQVKLRRPRHLLSLSYIIENGGPLIEHAELIDEEDMRHKFSSVTNFCDVMDCISKTVRTISETIRK